MSAPGAAALEPCNNIAHEVYVRTFNLLRAQPMNPQQKATLMQLQNNFTVNQDKVGALTGLVQNFGQDLVTNVLRQATVAPGAQPGANAPGAPQGARQHAPPAVQGPPGAAASPSTAPPDSLIQAILRLGHQAGNQALLQQLLHQAAQQLSTKTGRPTAEIVTGWMPHITKAVTDRAHAEAQQAAARQQAQPQPPQQAANNPGNALHQRLMALANDPVKLDSLIRTLKAALDKGGQGPAEESQTRKVYEMLLRAKELVRTRGPGGNRLPLPVPGGRPSVPGGLPQVSEYERALEQDRRELMAIKTMADAIDKQEQALGEAIQPPPYTPPEKSKDQLLLNELPTMQLLTDLVQEHGLKAAHPDCFRFLADAIQSHMVPLLQAMARTAKQRTDPARSRSDKQYVGPNIRQEVAAFGKAEKAIREKRQREEQAKRDAMLQQRPKKKMDDEQKEKLAQAKKEQSKEQAATQASATISQMLGKGKKKLSALAGGGAASGGGGAAAAGSGAGPAGNADAAAAGPAAASSTGASGKELLRGKMGGRFGKAATSVLGKRDAASAGGDAAGGGAAGSKKDTAVKKEPGAGSEGGTGKSAEVKQPAKKKVKTEPVQQDAAKTGPVAAAAAPKPTAPAVGATVKREPTPPAAQSSAAASRPGLGAAQPASGAAGAKPGAVVKREAVSAEKKPIELTARDLLSVAERDPVLCRLPAVWRIHAELAAGPVEVAKARVPAPAQAVAM